MHNIDTKGQVGVHICSFGGIRKSNYFGNEPVGRTAAEVRAKKLKNGKAAGKDEVTGEMIKTD